MLLSKAKPPRARSGYRDNPHVQRMMGAASPKIAQLIIEARAELTRLGIETEGRRSDELLNMAREQRNNSARTQWQTKRDHEAGAEPATQEKSAQ